MTKTMATSSPKITVKAAEQEAKKKAREETKAAKLAEKEAKAAKLAEQEAKKKAREEAKAAKAAEKEKEEVKANLDKFLIKLIPEIADYKKHYEPSGEGKAMFPHPIAEINVSWNKKKCCSKCRRKRCLIWFQKNNCGKGNIFRSGGLRSRRPECMDCQRSDRESKIAAKQIAKKQGISCKAPEGTVCELCGKQGTKDNPLVFDHHHELGVPRGYCCNRCNIGMGTLGDNVSSIAKVLKYLNDTEKLTKEEIMAMIGFD